jgi:antitoxin ParD1/3/4
MAVNTMSLIANTILEKLQALSTERQQVVLDLVEFLETDAWESIYQGNLAALRKEIQIGLDASAKGEVIDGEELFAQLQAKLQKKRLES